jgi:hypothetical protein
MKTLRSHVGPGLPPCRRASNPLYGVRAFCPARNFYVTPTFTHHVFKGPVEYKGAAQ